MLHLKKVTRIRRKKTGKPERGLSLKAQGGKKMWISVFSMYSRTWRLIVCLSSIKAEDKVTFTTETITCEEGKKT